LMVELEAVAVRGGIRVLELDTSLAQTAARALYASCGCPERGQVVLGGVTCVEFEKELGGV
jgi:hypothetical protein